MATLLLRALAGCSSEAAPVEPAAKGIDLEAQLAQLEDLGIVLNPEATTEDLLTAYSRDELEAEPFEKLVEVMSWDLEREPWTPISNQLWLCDFERIEGPGSYQRVVERLELMTGSALGLANIRDSVVLLEEDGPLGASVSFEHEGKPLRWEMRVEDDWLDPSVLTRYDRLLRAMGSNTRLFMARGNYGQFAFLGAFSADRAKRFSKLTGVAMAPIE